MQSMETAPSAQARLRPCNDPLSSNRNLAVESLDEPGAAEEAQWMRAVVVGLLRDADEGSAAGSMGVERGSAAAAPDDDDCLADGLPVDDFCEPDPADLDDLLADSEVPAAFPSCWLAADCWMRCFSKTSHALDGPHLDCGQA